MTEVEEFESLKAELEELRVKQIADSRERDRLKQEFDGMVASIRDEYGIEVEDFENAIASMRGELSGLLNELRNTLAELKAKMENDS